MKKLIDLLNELAVAEAEVEALEKKMDEEPENIDALEQRWDFLYKEQFDKCKEVVAKLGEYGIDEKTARKMVITRRSDLVAIAGMEV